MTQLPWRLNAIARLTRQLKILSHLRHNGARSRAENPSVA
jgi:hypothetical protein